MILVILSLLPAIPLSAQTGHYQSGLQAHSLPLVAAHDPNGTAAAFSATRAQFDLYTLGNAVTTGTAPPIPFGKTFNNSQTGTGVPGTSFNVTIPSSTSATENVTWNKIIVPKGNVSSTTYLRFDWRGILGNSTKASYFVYNGTGHPAFSKFVSLVNITKTITGGTPEANVGSPPVGCGPTDNCFDVTRYIGSNLTLTFRFDSNSTGKGLNVNVYNVALVSADASPITTYSHSMGLDPTNMTSVNHKADLIIPPGYFANVTYPKLNGQSGKLNHTWSQMILSLYYPSSYTQVKISQNGTSIFPTVSPASPIHQGKCPTFFCSKDSHIVSLNMTSGIKNALILISANSVNLGADVRTTLGGVPTKSWGPGDLLQVRVTLRQGVNATGDDYVSANRTGVTQVTQKFSNTREGTSLLNFTTPIPQDSTLLGPWTVNSTYVNGYDFGFNSTSFNLQQLSVTGFSYSGSNQRLSAQGTLTYTPANPSPVNVNGYVFAIDSSAGPASLSTPTITTGSGVYVSNISLVNGVFTSGQQLILEFTLVNSGYSAQTNMNASLTIDHEWVTGSTHNSNASISVLPGSGTFTINPKYVYRLNATLTPAGIQVVVRGITTGGSPVSALLPPGNPPVTSLRQHSGLFKITIKSYQLSGSGTCALGCTSSAYSPAYAYVLVNPPIPGRLLASGSFTSGTTGAYSTTMSSGRILGASKLTFLSLGIDPTGFAITVQGQSSQESTLLQSTIDSIPSATQNQPLSLVLHLKSNSTTVNMNITITLNIQDNTGTTRATQSVSDILIAPQATKDVQFGFNAPGNVGAYTLIFLSADYGAPLITGTLQVSLLQSNLQVIIPAIIGVAAAIVILMFFLFRTKPAPIPETTKDKTAGGKPKPNPGKSTSKSLI